MTSRTETIIDSTGRKNFVTFERHGYRTRIWEDRKGYIGSYMHTTKRVSFRGQNGVDHYDNTARGPLDAARQLVEFNIW